MKNQIKRPTKSIEIPFVTPAGFSAKYRIDYFNGNEAYSQTVVDGRVTREVVGTHDEADALLDLYFEEVFNGTRAP